MIINGIEVVCEEFYWGTQEIEQYYFYGEHSQSLMPFCTAKPEEIMPPGEYRVIDGECFRVCEGSIPKFIEEVFEI